MSDTELQRRRRVVAADPADDRAVLALARAIERADRAHPTVFVLSAWSDYEGLGDPRPFDSEERALEVLEWLLHHESTPGPGGYMLDEHSLDFFQPVAMLGGRELLPVSIVRTVARVRCHGRSVVGETSVRKFFKARDAARALSTKEK